jgi:hypothetical protein
MGSEAWGEKIEGGWYDDSRHIYRDDAGVITPSVTGVFDVLGLSDFSMINPSVLEWKRNFGSALHKAIELLVFGKLDWDSVDDALIPAVTGTEQWLKHVEYQPTAVEEKRIITLNGMKIGGTLDHRGSLVYKGKRRPCIIDLKTGSKVSETWTWQVGAYSGGAPKLDGDVYVGCALQIGKDGDVNPTWVDTLKAKQNFIILLAAANLAVNAKLAKFKNMEEE